MNTHATVDFAVDCVGASIITLVIYIELVKVSFHSYYKL